jgi:predicted phosphatase
MLRANGVKLYVASFNAEAKECCEYLDISHLFEEILYGSNKTKLEMVRHVIEANQQIKEYEMVFFDDDQSNLHEVKMATNVHTIHIDEYGLNFTHIGNMFSISGSVFPDLDMLKLV